ncbi:enoyl-CoA hydratase/carnithine racemase [Hypomontagnella submonticulosa]|nr:enoyl-CoA hydratase/carnithine racemase [Hypomontagnella submonticulosa]
MSSPTQLPPSITTPPPPVLHTLVSFPRPHILLVTLNRPQQLNAIPRPQHFALERLWDWFDAENSLRVAVITGAGRAFCAGADLKEWDDINSSSPSSSSSSAQKAVGDTEEQRQRAKRFPAGGFGGMSNRGGLKPIIAAVNGPCFGGGMEMAINCDLVVAAAGAKFGLPEVTIGVIALAGALPRLVRSVGRQRAAEMALSGKTYGAREMLAWGLVNEVVEGGGKGGGNEAVVEAALKWAQRIAGNSPDSVIVSREGLKLGWEGVGPEQGTDMLLKGWYRQIEKGENAVEGVRSFVERRKPVWKDSKL